MNSFLNLSARAPKSCAALLLAATAAPLSAQFVENVRTIPAVPIVLYSVVQHSGNVIGVDDQGRTYAWIAATETWGMYNLPAEPNLNGAVFTRRNSVAFAYNSLIGQAYQFGFGGWNPVGTTGQPTSQGTHAVATLPNNDVILFGGQDANGGLLNETWRLSAATNAWSLESTTNAPSAREWPAMATDGNGDIILFGGANSTSTFNDTWRFDGTDWSQVTTATSPTARTLSGMAYRPNTDTMVLLGGSLTTPNGTPVTDAWTFDGSDWTQVPSVPYFPGPTVVLAAAHDPASDEIVAHQLSGLATIISGYSGFQNLGYGCNCDGMTMPFALSGGGSARIGNSFAVLFNEFAPGNAIWMAFDGAFATTPAQIPGLPIGCDAQLQAITGSVLVAVSPAATPIPTYGVPIPNDPGLNGLQIFYQGVQLNLGTFAGCSSDVLNVRIGL